MIIKFSALERIRTNPKAFLEAGPKINGRSKLTRWQDALAHFHRGKSMQEAETYLIASFKRLAENSLNRRDLRKFTAHLYEYETDYSQLGSEKIEFRKNLSLDVTPDDQVSGVIPRVDINTESDGYSIYYFSRKHFEWESELRFPILQKTMANYFSCDPKHVKVGVYILEDGKHYSTTFTDDELKEATDEFNAIIHAIRRLPK